MATQSSMSIPLVKAYTPEEVSPIQVSTLSSEHQPEPPQRNIKSVQVIMFPWQVQVCMLVLFALFVTIGATYFWVEANADKPAWIPAFMTALWMLSGIGSLALMYWVWREFSRFGNELVRWAESLRSGHLSERMPVRRKFCPSYHLRQHLNSVSIDYQQVAGKLERRLKEQEQYIKQKQYYLRVLYDVASNINKSNSLDELFSHFQHTLKEVVKAESVTIKLQNETGSIENVAVEEEEREGSDNPDIEEIIIPIQYREDRLGVYSLFINKKDHPQVDDELELLMSLGQHLAMAIKKANTDGESRLLSIMEERTRMAHELHDSLAQTLVSMRYKVRLLDDSLHKEDDEAIWGELEGLEAIIDTANTELRSLISNFRAPTDGKGLVRSVELLAERFEMETSIEVFFHQNWNLETIPGNTEIEAVRIVQEALANIRKHSQAKTVRILMYSSKAGECRILVEDDGIGILENTRQISKRQPSAHSGEHIGLTVMQERATRINGEIQFESEEGEGTLVQLNFTIPAVENRSSVAT